MAVTGTPITAGSAPVTTQEAKDWMRVDISDDDTLIANLLLAATAYVENVTGRVCLTATKIDYRTDWDDPMELRGFPLSSVTSIAYLDADGASQTLSAALYDVDTVDEPGNVRLGYMDTYPTLRGDENGITITYVAGYGAAADVPETLKVAIKALTAHWYEHREAATEGKLSEPPLAVNAILWQYRVLEAG